MKEMLAAFIISALSLYAFSSAARGQKRTQGNDSMSEANRLWELAVAAKGGRQKLEQVNSLAVFYEYKRGLVSNELFVFPDKRWDWFDTGPYSKYPLIASVKNFEQKVSCINQRHVREGCEPIGNFSKRSYLEDPQLLYLLETKWVKPELIAASKDTLGIRPVDVVKVQLEMFQISVYLDTRTHLPIRVAYHVTEDGPRLKAGDVFEWYGLSDYQDVDGILLPHKISHTHSPTRRLRYEINPEYDPSIFTRKPDLMAGPEQWRSKKYSSSPKK